jgi:predicted amidohydrolase YtcJ
VFVGNADALERMKPSEAFERIAIASASGVIAVVSKGTDEELWKTIHQFGLPLLKSNQLPELPADSYQDAAKQTWNFANALKLQSRRGRINREYFADLLFFSEVPIGSASDSIDWKKLARVMVAGETVWENGKRTGGSPGIFLRRT